MLLIHSRHVVAMARARAFPAALGRRNARGIPAGAVALVTGLSVVAILLGRTIREYAVLAVVSVMLMQLVYAPVALRLPTALPAAHAGAGFRLGPAARRLWGGATIAGSALFIALAVGQDARIVVAYPGGLGLGIVYYGFRRRWLRARGFSLDAVLRSGARSQG
jgi:amino acid transporter